jgi:hypothetical protein
MARWKRWAFFVFGVGERLKEQLDYNRFGRVAIVGNIARYWFLVFSDL